MRVSIYGRVSTIDKQNPEMQLSDLRKYAEARGWNVSGEFVDRCSGARDKRPELDRLMEACRKRQIDGILVWRLDRWGRSLKHLINSLDELRALGISFISFSENIDLSTSTGQLLFHLLGAFAEFERNLIKERVVAGIANAKAKGVKFGRPRRFHDDMLFEVKEFQKAGLSIRAIAKKLKVSPALVHKLAHMEKNQNPLNQASAAE